MNIFKDRGIQICITAAAPMAMGTIIVNGHPYTVAALWTVWAGLTAWAIAEYRRKLA